MHNFHVKLIDAPYSLTYCLFMNIVKKFLHTRMRVNDLERTVNFYKTVLGLKELERHESPRGSKLVFLRIPNSDALLEITFFPGTGNAECPPDLMHLAFQVESLDAFQKHIEKLGITFSDGPTLSTSTKQRFAFIDAPEGYEIELIETV